jgi:hypothetical protein
VVEEKFSVHFTPGDTPRLLIHAQYELRNTGNKPLEFVDVVIPDAKTFGTSHPQFSVDGRAVSPAGPSQEKGQDYRDEFHIPLAPQWKEKEKRELAIEYELTAPQDSGAQIGISRQSFYLLGNRWYPLLLPPNHILSPTPKRPDRTQYTVRVPEKTMVLARGKVQCCRRSGGETEYRFELKKGDFYPFVVAGEYAETRVQTPDHAITFWTFEPPAMELEKAAARISESLKIMEANFGPPPESIRTMHIVEFPGLRSPIFREETAVAEPFPGGALVSPSLLNLGPGGDECSDTVLEALTHTWIQMPFHPALNSGVGIGEGFPLYATTVIAQGRGGAQARAKCARHFLAAYDALVKETAEVPLASVTLDSPSAAIRIALQKAPLFYIALEDSYGEAQVRAGIKNMITLLRGQNAGYDDLRSALEQSTGANLAPFFRSWLYEKGIPAEFRARHELPSTAGP